MRPDDSEKCRFIKGATEGTLFPRNLDPTVKNYVFRKPFCRHMPIEFKKKGMNFSFVENSWKYFFFASIVYAGNNGTLVRDAG